MPPPPPQIRTNRTRTRRFSACNRHPTEPVTGFCALCLRDRLAGLDSSSPAPSPAPEFRRSKSVAGEKCEVLNGLVLDPRRNSCDVRARSTLSDLFVVDDKRKARGGDATVGSVKLGFSRIAEPVMETKDAAEEEEDDDDDDNNGDDGEHEIRVSDDVIERTEIDDVDEVIEGDLKTMKEIIEMELRNKRRNFLPAASILSQKLRKWRNKQKEKKQSRCTQSRSKLGQLSQFGDTQSEIADYGFGRRSCDTEPRFSIDAHRLSVEDPRFSLDEHRASWDGYMTARTIPRLTPMLSVVDNMTLAPVNLQMHSIREDRASSGGSGYSNSDYFSSNRGSSSSLMKSSSTKTAGFGGGGGGDDVKSASIARVSPASDVIFQGTKLVITEKELKDWHLNSIKNNNNNNNNIESASNAPNSTSKTSAVNMTNIVNLSIEQKKKVMSSRWRKVCNLWGQKW